MDITNLIEFGKSGQVFNKNSIIEYLSNLDSDRDMFKELEEASKSSMDFWNNDIDDEVWNKINELIK